MGIAHPLVMAATQHHYLIRLFFVGAHVLHVFLPDDNYVVVVAVDFVLEVIEGEVLRLNESVKLNVPSQVLPQ